MELNQDTFEQIEAYLEGRLSGKDLKDLEQRIQTDPVFAAAVNTQQRFMKGIEKAASLDLKKKLESIHGQVVEADKPPVVGLGFGKPLLLLAAVFSILGLIYFLSPPKNNPANTTPTDTTSPPIANNEAEKIFAEGRPIIRTVDIQLLNRTLRKDSIQVSIYSAETQAAFKWNKKKLNLYWVGDKPDISIEMLLIAKNNQTFDLKIGDDIYEVFVTTERTALKKR